MLRGRHVREPSEPERSQQHSGDDEELVGLGRALLISAARAVLAATVGLALAASAPVALGWRSGVVLSGSMEPILRVGDVVVSAPPRPDEPRLGQVIAVQDPEKPGRVLVHRLVRIEANGSLVTKGDANARADSSLVRPSGLEGVARIRVPWIGNPALWARHGDAAPVAGLAVVVVLLGWLATGGSRPRLPPGPVFAVLLLVPTLHPMVLRAAFAAQTDNTGNTFGATGTFPTYQQAVLADSPVAYYRSDDAATSAAPADSSGGAHTGVYLSPTSGFQAAGGPAGAGDPALQFTAASNSATVAANTALSSPDTYTTEVWFKTSSAVNQRLLQFADVGTGTSTTTDRMISMTAAGKLSLVVNTTTVTSTASYNDGAWHLATASLGAAGMKLYVDGSVVASNAGVTSGLTIATGYWRLGGDSGVYFVGTLDEAAVFTSQLTDAQVSAHYTAGSPAASLAAYTSAVKADGPWAFWHLNDAPLTVYQGGAFATPAADVSGQSHPATIRNIRPIGMVGGGATPMTGASAGGTSVRFKGSGFGYDPVSYANPQSWTEELWFRTTSTNGGMLFQFTNATTGYPGTYDRMAYVRNDGKVTYGLYNGSAVVQVVSAAANNDGNWHHVVGTGGAAGLMLYLDGGLVASNTSATTAQNTTGYFRWGGGNASWSTRPTSDYLDGAIDEVAFYLTQLTSQQVAWHYHANH